MAFYPFNNKSQTIAVGLTSAATQLSTISDVAPGQMNVTYELQNTGSAPVFIAFGNSTVTTTVATGYPILVGQSKVIDIPNNVDANKVTHFATISGAASQTLTITPGYGQ
jgi:hypothetical protein